MAQPRPETLPVWAETGDKTQPSSSEIQVGWPLSNIPPSRQRFNWFFNFAGNAVRYLLQFGVPEWATAETYPVGARVQFGGLTYVSLQAHSGQQPDVSPNQWERWGFSATQANTLLSSVLTKSVAGNTDVALTAAEAANGVIVLTGALTGNINVIVPNTARRWVVKNSTTGAFTLTFKTATGSGVTLYRNANHFMFSDGANINYLSPRLRSQSVTATAGQTVFNVAHVPGNAWVTRQGLEVDFTSASDGSSLTLTVAASVNDVVRVHWL